jgi:hypothetical protein
MGWDNHGVKSEAAALSPRLSCLVSGVTTMRSYLAAIGVFPCCLSENVNVRCCALMLQKRPANS